MIRVPRSTLALLSSAAMVAATAGAAVAAPPSQGHAHSRARLAGSVPSWADAAHRQRATSAQAPVDFKLYLGWRHADQAAQYAMAASSGNAKFLTPAQFRARFAPTGRQVGAATHWLRSQGFKVGFVPSNHKYVEARGTAAQAAQAFGTSFAQYRVHGMSLRSNTTPLSVPAGLHVEAVTGLDQSFALVQSDAPPPGGFRNAQPCSDWWGQKTVDNTTTPDGTQLPDHPANFAPCGYTPDQLQHVYGMADAIDSGNDGSGQTVAIIDAYSSPTAFEDLQKYSDRFGLTPITHQNFQQIQAPGTWKRPNNPQHSPSGWSGEETLDLEAVHTMAPGADILYVGSPNNRQDMDAALNKIVNNNLADIVSNSYGFSGEAVPAGYRKPFNDIAIQADAEGISLFFSSGDYGDETMGDATATSTPDWPASSPWVTAVGGTSLGIGQDNQRVFEFGWETGREKLVDGQWSEPKYQYGSGGGTSRFFTQPAYQQGVVGTDYSELNGSSVPMRSVPDVAALGDPTTGMLVGQTQTFPDGTYYDYYRIGGTSLASPLYAGMFALAAQHHGRFGLANYALYATASYGADGTTVDITPPADPADTTTDPTGAVRADYTNGVDDQVPAGTPAYAYTARLFDYEAGMKIHVGTGYDDVTGLGVPNGGSWIDALSTYGGTTYPHNG